MTTPDLNTAAIERLTRPIIGIENRTPLEAFDIMADRIRSFLSTLKTGEPVPTISEGEGWREAVARARSELAEAYDGSLSDEADAMEAGDRTDDWSIDGISPATVKNALYAITRLLDPPTPAVQPERVNDPHRFAVVSSDFVRPFLVGAYPTMENAIKAQCGSPEKWLIYERAPAVQRQDEREGWQDIATAKHTHALMIIAPNRYGVVDTVCWNDSKGDAGGWDDGFDDDDRPTYEPQIWQPVPTLPAVQRQDERDMK